MRAKRPFIKIGLIALLVVAGVTLLCSLGFWQLQRAKQKEDILAQLQKGMHHQILNQEALTHPIAPISLRYHRIALKGEFLNQYTILLDNVTNKSSPGYYVYVPFQFNDDHYVLVNRGWIPLGPSRQKIPLPPGVKGEVTIEGYLDFAYRNPFIRHALETDSVQWPLRVQQLDLGLLGDLTGKKINKMLVVLDKSSPYAFELPHTPGTQMTPSRHRGYAFQWFSLAALLVVLSLLSAYHFRGKA